MATDASTTRRPSRLGLYGVAISSGVLALKWAAWRATGSAALLADAVETVVNVAAAVIAAATLWLSAQPADKNHTYGHDKAEYLSALCEGALMLVAAAANSLEVYRSWLRPHPPSQPLLGLQLQGVAALINLCWGMVLTRTGRRQRSVALIASGRHVLGDVCASAGVIVGFTLVASTGWLRVDACIAAAVTANILYGGLHNVRMALAGLMDELSDPNILATLKELIRGHGDGAREAHDIRARVAGRATFIEFHLVVEAEMRVGQAHAICDRLEAAIRAQMGPAVISIHIEPPDRALGPDPNAVLLRAPPTP